MRLWFHPKIEKQGDAARVIQTCSGIFYFLAATDIGFAFILFAAGPEVLRYMSLPQDAIISFLGTGIRRGIDGGLRCASAAAKAL